MTKIDIFDGPLPKRGDIVQSNVGDRRERTWMVLHARKMRCLPKGVPRFDVWMVRWWELEADFRMRLYRSAERAGGQNVLFYFQYQAKKKKQRINLL